MLKLFNTLSRKKEVFKPVQSGIVRMYNCGPTVYNLTHIGHFMAYTFADVLRRYLESWKGFEVKQIINLTDVGHMVGDAEQGEDKIEMQAKKEGISVQQVIDKYSKNFIENYGKILLQQPMKFPKATEHIIEMIEIIKVLIANGYAYESGGNVYFSIDSFKGYGKLSHFNIEELKAGAGQRSEQDPLKKNQLDFALWFSTSKFKGHVLKWPSPWGEGYPGWHIECSAMSMKYLGETFDIHCGGIDHIPVHHTNEIAQSEGATGKNWVDYWLHGEFLVMDKGKMSKSSGEILTLKVLIDKGFNPLDYRYLCLNTQYRTPLTFSFEALEAAKNAFDNLKSKVIEFRKSDLKIEHKELIEGYKEEFTESINDDLNMPKALAVLWAVAKDKELNDHEKYSLIIDFDEVFGLDLKNAKEIAYEIPSEITDLINQRQEAKKAKDFAKADEIRNKITSLGYAVDDTSTGPKARKL